MTFTDVTELAASGGQIDVYLVQNKTGAPEPVLVPAVLTVDDPLRRDHPIGRPVYPVDDRGRTDKTQPPLGLGVGVTVGTMFGSEISGTLHTTQAAENRAAAEFLTDRTMLRHTLALPADQGAHMSLVPVYGASINITAFVAGIDPQEALQVAQDALAAALPEHAHLTLRKAQSRAVENRRVNLFDSATGEALAIDVLEAEAFYVAGRSSYRSEPIPAGVVRGRR